MIIILSLLYVTIIITVLINARGVPAGIVVVTILLFLFHAL